MQFKTSRFRKFISDITKKLESNRRFLLKTVFSSSANKLTALYKQISEESLVPVPSSHHRNHGFSITNVQYQGFANYEPCKISYFNHRCLKVDIRMTIQLTTRFTKNQNGAFGYRDLSNEVSHTPTKVPFWGVSWSWK